MFSILTALTLAIQAPPSKPVTLGRTAWIFSTVGHSEWCPAGNVKLDLRTGRFELTPRADRRVCGDHSLQRPIKMDKLNGAKLGALRTAYLRVLAEGVESHACRYGEPHDIIINNGGVPILIVATGYATRSAPDDWGCWSEAANSLHELLNHAFAPQDYGAEAAPARTPYLCNYGRTKIGRTAVHGSAAASSRVTTSLRPRTSIYICDESEGWYKVHFGTATRPCPHESRGLIVRRAEACASGWVRREQVVVVSG